MQIRKQLKPDATITLQIFLAQNNVQDAEKELLQVSDPTSPHYGVYWSKSKVDDMFAPAPSSLQAVLVWLEHSALASRKLRIALDKSIIELDTPVFQIEKLLGTTCFEYVDSEPPRRQHACDEYKIPAHLAEHIDFIAPSLVSGLPLAMDRSQGLERPLLDWQQAANAKRDELVSASKCSKLITLDCLRSMYKLPANTSISVHPSSTVGAIQLGWGSWLPDDLDSFFRRYAPSLLSMRPIMQSVNGGTTQNHTQNFIFNGEANLDFEYIMALTGRPAIDYQIESTAVGRPTTLNPLLGALDKSYCKYLNASIDGVVEDLIPYPQRYNKTADCGTIPKLPSVLSVSYAWNEDWFPAAYIKRQCLEFLKLGLQGVTVIVASADSGAAGQDGTCLGHMRYNPTNPSTCPYVTSVGATQLQQNATSFDDEIAFLKGSNLSATPSSSGGGFSNIFDAPLYQRTAIQGYFEDQAHLLTSQSSKFNRNGRGFPDISAIGKNYAIALNGKLQTIHGTSASAPTVASLITLINDKRLQAGKGTVGFINPILYQHQSVMNDIATGENYGCNGTKAFNAVRGWDPVTGLGTLNFQKLLKVYRALP
ncbi:subtilisin-like protein [Tothia fuscella]|uniref:tripeptidyl-peptidase II n=1 Tax=Tothia fuscella TaxID=1048955 RepID=A0A9P4NPR4_9PEZI|nr:subtilisin-like protein [Tothia fuscella]